jgi:hypothetical protein
VMVSDRWNWPEASTMVGWLDGDKAELRSV